MIPILSPILDLIGTAVDKALPDKNKALEVTQEISGALIAAQGDLTKHMAATITSEASGNFLQRSWRPITMLVFLGLVVFDSFGLLANPLSPEMWSLLKIGLGGYVGGRSLEKIVAKVRG